jgi:hypothetical protein
MNTRLITARLALIVVALTLAWSAPAVAQDEVPDACRTIIGCPDAGPKPEHPGDRGGYAQFLTLGMLIVGVGFIGIKITRAVREGDKRTLNQTE